MRISSTEDKNTKQVLNNLFYVSAITITVGIAFVTYVYLEAKESVLNNYALTFRRSYPPIDREKVKIRFKKVSFSKKEIIHFWFLWPHHDVSDRGIPWSLRKWNVDYAKLYYWDDLDMPTPDEIEVEVEIK